MEREDLPALRALGFEDDELKELDLWEPAAGTPAELAEMYVRRSKKKDSLSALREQVRRMCAHARSEGKKIRRVWFEQRSASKAYVRREEFENATAAIAENGLSKTLYVYKTSRLSRRGMGQVGLLLDNFEEQGARIYVVAENIDSTNSRMILAFLSEQAREQVADLGQFTKLGMDAHKADGKWTGGVTPYGLRAVKGEGRLEHDPEEYATARRIAGLDTVRRTGTAGILCVAFPAVPRDSRADKGSARIAATTATDTRRPTTKPRQAALMFVQIEIPYGARKRCRECGRLRDLRCFAMDPSQPDHYRPDCVDCESADWLTLPSVW
ncbi:hypothetical protein GCM10010512_05940 [Streptomyces thermoviolaceus subsp. thermoviolaceus]|uniref:Recombinase family protein n=1 Tax=Streptomyces thermoviolaceus subsp. thermoviolaceus TaxID=66860 RepID=A0ABX0YTD0_STRTL|nr:recombinase family protein [Streptomyces thermoviolaceus]NJP14386.1 recombinase family protein [Streptomyces thermoviolaceus subsp. thermoviolaceus]GHA78202.1 hypothetical protein GCM10010512_05940 [Streptomyces thermoviolaceus subsp. thermoviolaceus]